MKILTDFKNSKNALLPKVSEKQYDQIITKRMKINKVLDNYENLDKNYNCKLFCYGTIKQKKVRNMILKRKNHKVRSAILKGYELKREMEIEKEKYLVIRKNSQSQIKGNIYEFSVNELEFLDIYETNNYMRKEIIDQNGDKIWVYCEAMI